MWPGTWAGYPPSVTSKAWTDRMQAEVWKGVHTVAPHPTFHTFFCCYEHRVDSVAVDPPTASRLPAGEAKSDHPALPGHSRAEVLPSNPLEHEWEAIAGGHTGRVLFTR